MVQPVAPPTYIPQNSSEQNIEQPTHMGKPVVQQLNSTPMTEEMAHLLNTPSQQEGTPLAERTITTPNRKQQLAEDTNAIIQKYNEQYKELGILFSAKDVSITPSEHGSGVVTSVLVRCSIPRNTPPELQNAVSTLYAEIRAKLLQDINTNDPQYKKTAELSMPQQQEAMNEAQKILSTLGIQAQSIVQFINNRPVLTMPLIPSEQESLFSDTLKKLNALFAPYGTYVITVSSFIKQSGEENDKVLEKKQRQKEQIQKEQDAYITKEQTRKEQEQKITATAINHAEKPSTIQ